jgi:hypothetical protein
MASESVAIDPAMHRALPMLGNYTHDAYLHLWCAQALAQFVASEAAYSIWADDIREALRWLLSCEVRRAHVAASAERGDTCGHDDPYRIGSAPKHGNYTADLEEHLRCARALGVAVGNDESFGIWSDDTKAALRFLLQCEIGRADKAFHGEAVQRRLPTAA